MTPFSIDIPQQDIDDGIERVRRTRWPEQASGRPWLYGSDIDYMKSVASRWGGGYDWRQWEARLNRLPNYTTQIGGRQIHFIVVPGSGSNPLPVLFLHGWPGSFLEFLDVVEPLTWPELHGGDPEDGITMVIPSLPGFGFSEGDPSPVLPSEIARRFAGLMVETLGYRRYGVQGGDWGGIIGSWMALEHGAEICALHLNGPGLAGGHDEADYERLPLSAAERDWLARNAAYRKGRTAYQDILGTEPQTLAYAWSDSPIGLAAWILQRFQAWTRRGSVEAPPFDLDHLLTNVMLYWFRGINIPNWLYVSLVEGTARRIGPGRRVDVPTGFTLCPNDNTIPAPDEWLGRVFANIVHRRDAPAGGHFLAFEQPGIFAKEVGAFFARYR